MLEAGYAETEITPPLGGSMPGYFHDRQATGILDPLMAKAPSVVPTAMRSSANSNRSLAISGLSGRACAGSAARGGPRTR